MGFFSDLKEDLSQAVNELMPEEELDQAAVEETKEQPVENTQETTEATPMEPQTEEPPNDNAAMEEMMKNLDSIEIPQEKEELPEEDVEERAGEPEAQERRDHQRQIVLAVEPAPVGELHVLRDDDRLHGHEHRQDDHREERTLEAEFGPREGVPRHRAGEHMPQRADNRHPRAVPDVALEHQLAVRHGVVAPREF